MILEVEEPKLYV